MLTPEYMDELTNNKVVNEYEKLNQELTNDIIGLIIAFNMNDSKKVINKNGNKLFNKSLSKIQNITSKRKKELKDLFNDMLNNQIKDYENIYKSKDINMNLAVMKQILNATIKVTNNDLSNLTRTIAYKTKQTYVDSMNNLYKEVITGSVDYTTAINRVVNILSKSGITLTTSNGRNERIETAVKRGLHGSIKTTADAIAKQIGNDIGYNCVRIGHSYKCRPSHHPIDDVIMSKEEFKKYEYLTEEYNCNHFVNYLWLEEFEKSDKTIYGEEHGTLEEVRKNYEYRQKLNYLKNQVKSKRSAIASGNNSVKLKNELRNARIKLNTFLSNSKKDTNIKVVVLNKGMEFKYKGKTYIVDGKNVKNEFNSKEREFANWLANNTNKTVALNPKINEPDGIKVPDLKIDNEYYDMKIITGSSKQIIYHNVYGKQEQASNFLFEASSSPLTLEELKNQVYKVFKRTDVTHVKKIGIKKNSDFILLKKE